MAVIADAALLHWVYVPGEHQGLWGAGIEAALLAVLALQSVRVCGVPGFALINSLLKSKS